MKFGRILFLFALFVALGASAMAQSSSSVVKVRPGSSGYTVKQGAAKLEVVLDIDGGYHINSNRPNDRNLVATALKFDKMPGLELTPVVYPKAKMQKFEFSEKPLSVFEGNTVLRFTARALPTLPAGSHTLKGKLTIQACNDQLCLRPQTVDVSVPIKVVK